MNASIISKQAPARKDASQFYKEELIKAIKGKYDTISPKFIRKEYTNKINNEFCPFNKIIRQNIPYIENTLSEIFDRIQTKKKSPIQLSVYYFDLFILINNPYIKRDQPFALNHLVNNYQHYINSFNLKSIHSQEEFKAKVVELNNFKDSEEIIAILKPKLITNSNILSTICIFTLLFNNIITISPERKVAFVSDKFSISTRAKEMLYNFIKAITQSYILEWFYIICYIQGPFD